MDPKSSCYCWPPTVCRVSVRSLARFALGQHGENIPCFLPVQKFLLLFLGIASSHPEELVSRIAFLSNKFMPHWKSVSQPHTIRACRAVLTLSLLFLGAKRQPPPFLSPTWSCCCCIMVRWGRSLTLRRRLHLRFTTLVVLSLPPRNVPLELNWIEYHCSLLAEPFSTTAIEKNRMEARIETKGNRIS